VADAIRYARLPDRLGLDVFALGEHHAPELAVPSPAVVLAAVAARTQHIRLTSGVTVLPVLDPARVYEDLAQVTRPPPLTGESSTLCASITANTAAREP